MSCSTVKCDRTQDRASESNDSIRRQPTSVASRGRRRSAGSDPEQKWCQNSSGTGPWGPRRWAGSGRGKWAMSAAVVEAPASRQNTMRSCWRRAGGVSSLEITNPASPSRRSAAAAVVASRPARSADSGFSGTAWPQAQHRQERSLAAFQGLSRRSRWGGDRRHGDGACHSVESSSRR